MLLNRESLIVGKSLESVELKVEKLNLNSSILLLKFFDVNDRDSAEKYRDYELYIHRSELVKDDDDLFLVDLIGCDLFFDKNFVLSSNALQCKPYNTSFPLWLLVKKLVSAIEFLRLDINLL